MVLYKYYNKFFIVKFFTLRRTVYNYKKNGNRFSLDSVRQCAEKMRAQSQVRKIRRKGH